MVSNRRSPTTIILLVLWASLFESVACQTTVRPVPAKGQTSVANYQATVLAKDPDTTLFKSSGPFKSSIRENIEIKLGAGQVLVGDMVSTNIENAAPLVIFVHGNHSRKEAHRLQAIQLASLGQHALLLQVTNSRQWLQNGRLIAALVKTITRHPNMLGPSINTNRIVLVGHSFGGSAVSVAAGSGIDICGLILLDPAVFNKQVGAYIQQIKAPVILLGADKKRFRSKRRQQFFDQIPSAMAEISVSGATHDDAQNPSMFSLHAFGFDPFTSKTKQKQFTAALAASVFSFVTQGDLDYAWRAFAKDIKRGDMKDARLRRVGKDGAVIELSR